MTKASERNKAWREANPMMYCYMTLRDNSKRRGIPFTITYEYFRRFCYRTQYMKCKGRYRINYSLDRVKNELGYIPGNLKVIPVSMNCSKGTRAVTYDWYRESKFYVT